MHTDKCTNMNKCIYLLAMGACEELAAAMIFFVS